MITKICAACGAEYRVRPSNAESSKYCSRKCNGSHRISAKRIGWVDGYAIYQNRNRVNIVLGTRREQDLARYIVEKALGRALSPTNIVHHVDGNPLNNENSNLVVLQNKREHAWVHRKMQIIRLGGNPKIEKPCAHCSKMLPFSRFSKATAAMFGRYSYCDTCSPLLQARNRVRRKQHG